MASPVTNDTYFFNIGDDFTTFDVSSGNDTIRLGSGLSGQNFLQAFQDETSAYIYFGPDIGQFRLENYFAAESNAKIIFADGSSWDKAYVTRLINAQRNRGFDTVRTGTTKTKKLTGGKGDDLLMAGAVNTTLDGGAGDDYLEGGIGNDTLIGGVGNDYLTGGKGNDVLNGGAGIDTIIDIDGCNTIYGGDGDDQIIGTGFLSGDAGEDHIESRGHSTVLGGAGNDSLFSSGEYDCLFGGDGNDSVEAYFDHATVYGGAGSDALSVMGASMVDGGDGDDYLWGGGSGGNTLFGGKGNDELRSFGSADFLNGGVGNDFLDGGWHAAGDVDVLNGGTGNDFYRVGSLGDGSDIPADSNFDVRIIDSDTKRGNTDTLSISSGSLEIVDPSLIWFQHQDNDLVITRIANNTKITIQDWYKGSGNHIERIELIDGYGLGERVLLDTAVEKLVQAMAGFAPPAAGTTTLPSNYQAVLNPVIAANWQ